VISPGYNEDQSGTLSQREEQPSAHVIGDNVQASMVFVVDSRPYRLQFQ